MEKRMLKILLVLLCAVFCVAIGVVVAIATTGAGTTGAPDATTEIEAQLGAYKVGSTIEIEDDGTIGIPVDISFYVDKAVNPSVKTGDHGTPVIMYVVNTNTERAGTDSDVTIIRSMLERGYVVAVYDYHNSVLATSIKLEDSLQLLRKDILNGVYTKTLGSPFPTSGSYDHHYIVPAGHNVQLGDVFWEADKHGADGTLEKIVQVWNSDLKGSMPEKLVKWVHEDGSRKKTETAYDGTAPEWYDSNGNASSSGQYTKLKYTVAETITDCVNPDGTPVDLNLYINIIYPTNPEKPVPMLATASSAGHIASNSQKEGRPHQQVFAFNGYAVAVYDHFYTPMADNDSFGYFDGKVSGTGTVKTRDPISYSLDVYNDKKTNTAAIRYIRYLAMLEEGDPDYSFNLDIDLNAIGVMGVSKGGTMNFLGEKIVQSPLVDKADYATTEAHEKAINDVINSFANMRVFTGHHGETRYDNGITETYTKDGVTIDGGELQPWLTYKGAEIISGVQLTYCAVGNNPEDIHVGHSPVVVSRCLLDGGDGYTLHGFDNICRTMGIPSITLEYELGHTMMYGNDVKYDADGLRAFLDFTDYYLKDSAIKVVYISPLNKEADVETTSKITVQFSGTATADKLALVTVKDAAGNLVSGTWTSDYGGTQWHFAPANALLGNTKYTVTVPATFSGDNNVEMGADASVSFTTREAVAGSATVNNNYVTATVPNLTADTNSFVLRFYVSEEKAANIAKVYAVSSTTDTAGTLLGSVNLRGAGFYELDVTAYAAEHQGEIVYFRVDAEKLPVVNNPVYKQEFNGYNTLGDCVISRFSKADGTQKDVLAVYAYPKSYYASSNQTVESGYNSFNTTDTAIWYEEVSEAFSNAKLFKSSKLTEEDYGRHFTVSIDVYDTISRKLQFKITSCSNATNDTIDYDVSVYNLHTVAGQWTTFTFDYQVYDSKYGAAGNIQKGLTVYIGTDGDAESLVKFDNLTVTETVTDVTVTSAAVVAVNNGGVEYKTPENAAAPFTVGTQTYTTLKAALEAAAASNGVVTLNSNYTFKDSDLYSGYVSYPNVDFVIDLNGYYVKCDNTTGALININNSAAASGAIDVTLKNGAVLLKRTALVQYTASSGTGNGNTFNVNIENVNIALQNDATLSKVICSSTIAANAAAAVNVNLNEVNITALNAENGEHRTVIFSKSARDTTDVIYTVKGGSIKLSDFRRIAISDVDIRSLVFVQNSTGERTELIIQNSKKASSESYWSDDTYKSFLVKTVGETHTVYTLEDGALKTPYGMIPEEYANVDYYPWVVFDVNGVLEYAGKEFALDNTASVLKSGSKNTDTWNAYLRRDFHYEGKNGHNNLSFIYGIVNLDLNGHTFYHDATRAMFNAQGKNPETTTIRVFNGDIAVNKSNSLIVSSVSKTTALPSGTKVFNFTFDDVDFTFNTGASNLIASHGNCADGVRVVTNITLNDCNIDASALSGKTVFSLGQSSGTAGAAVLTVNGGSLKVSDAATKLYNLNNGVSSVTFGKGASGEFFKMIQPSSLAAPSFSTPSSEFVLSFGEGVEDGSNMVYTLIPGGEITEYGPIGQSYLNADQYPFAVFCNGKLLGVASKFSAGSNGDGTALGIALAESKNLASDDTVITILVRRDYTMTGEELLANMAQMRGTFVIDLDEHTFTSNTYMFNGQSKGSVAHPASVVVKDGGLAVKMNALIKATAWGSAYVGGKNYNFDFDNVTFSFASGATAKNILVNYVDDASTNKTSYLNIDLKDCDFDLANAPDGVTVLNANDPTSEIIATVKTDNCRILSDTANGFTYLSVNATNGSSVNLGEGNGTLTLVLPAEAAAPTTKVTNAGKEYSLVKIATEGDKAVYRLLSMVTPYGTIPDEYSSIVAHPFVIFYNGAVIGTSTTFSDQSNGGTSALGVALKKLTELNDDNAVVQVLMRADCNSTGSVVDNWAGLKGTVIIDLGGNTINANSYVLNAQAKGSAAVSNITVRNGRINVGKQGVLKAETFGSTYAGNKVYNYTFENMTFGFMSGATTKSLLVTYLSNETTAKTAALNIALNNCTFDMTNAPSGVTLFNANDSVSGEIITKITVTGCKIVTEKADTFVLSSIHASNGSKIDYFKGADDSYIKLLVADENSLPLATTVISTPEGTGSFLKMGKEDGMTLYKVAFSKKTEYGYIPAQYESAQDYPFVAFDKDGNFLGASAELYGAGSSSTAFHKAKNASTENGVVIVLLRRDYTIGKSEYYDNLAQFKGTLIFDLGGHKLERVEGVQALFRVTSKGTNDTNIVVKNGRIDVFSGAVMAIKGVTSTAVKTFNFTYENVIFGLATGANAKSLITEHDYQQDMTNNVNVTLNNCTIDLKTVEPAGLITIFDMNDPKGFNVLKVVVNKTKILIAGPSKVTLNNAPASNGSSIAWNADGEGGRNLVYVPTGAEFSAELKNSAGEKVIAKLFSTDDGCDIYELVADTLRIAGAYLSLDQDIDFIYVANIPESYSDPYMVFTLNGKSYTVTDYFVKDGYYMFALCAVTPKHMGDNVSATLYATKDGASVSVSKEEYSIKEYCEDLIELYPDDAKLMTLVSNLLAYGAASQEYADYKTDSLVTSGLTLTPSTFEPLKEDANKLAIDGESAQGLAWTSASLTLGSKTTVRFSFIAENAEGLQVKVTVGGREQVFNVSELIAEQGTTYEICFTDVMVTEYDSDITAEFVRDGETVGETLTYSVNTYIYEVQDNTDAEFAALVKAIYLYGKAAADYAAQD